jgi:hypothetical protein
MLVVKLTNIYSIKFIYKNMAKTKGPEAGPKTPEVPQEIERNPFYEQESVVVKSITEQYAKETKIDGQEKKEVASFLSRDSEKVYRDFALVWFENNKAKITKEIGLIPPNASDEWKMSTVLGSKEQGFMGAGGDMNKPEYAEFRTKMDKIGVLMTDMKKDVMPPATPFLILNYLQNSIREKENKIKELRKSGEAGDARDASAIITADSLEKDREEMYETMKKIAGTTMGEDLAEKAEAKVFKDGFKNKEETIASKLEDKKSEVKEKKEQELINKEWEAFSRLPDKEKEKQCIKLGLTKESDIDAFRDAVIENAKKQGIEETALYGMLAKDYKPYQITSSKFLWVGKETFIVPGPTGSPEKMSAERLNNLKSKLGDNYSTEIDSSAQRILGREWREELEGKITLEVKNRVEELAKSPEGARNKIEKLYNKARERITDEYIQKFLKKAEKTEEKRAEIEKHFKEKSPEKSIKDFYTAAIFQQGRLENLGDDFGDSDQKAVGGFLREWGIKGTNKNILSSIDAGAYKKARKTQLGFFNLIMKLLEASLMPKP